MEKLSISLQNIRGKLAGQFPDMGNYNHRTKSSRVYLWDKVPELLGNVSKYQRNRHDFVAKKRKMGRQVLLHVVFYANAVSPGPCVSSNSISQTGRVGKTGMETDHGARMGSNHPQPPSPPHGE